MAVHLDIGSVGIKSEKSIIKCLGILLDKIMIQQNCRHYLNQSCQSKYVENTENWSLYCLIFCPKNVKNILSCPNNKNPTLLDITQTGKSI